ncbi:unnamed protein product [Blepharisma stoltei]|uniref:Uncharacterized protein n=1 Tax=Blepharisma stoltei TaxID=1481888 RepID=A0AAU9INL4_9CILI|nr:unnamed protein product [Blepharisma stoltei]
MTQLLSAPATSRWKRELLSETTTKFNLANHRRLSQMVSTQDASRFFSGSVTPFDETEKVSKFEELREISSQLGILRNRHDYTRARNSFHEKNLESLQNELDIVNKMGTRTGVKLENMREEAEKMEKLLNDIKKQQDDALIARKACEHMIERMKMTKIHLEKRNLSLAKSLREKQQTLKEELDKQRRTREGRIQTRGALKSLEGYINRETREKVDRLQAIEKDVKQKKEVSIKREERISRQMEIAEAAANEDRNLKAIRMREGLLIHKMWNSFLQKKMEVEMEKNTGIDLAFQRIRRVAGLNDVGEMIEKFLTREQLYAELMERLNDVNKRIEDYNQKNLEMEEKIHGLEIAKKENNNPTHNLSLVVYRGSKETARMKIRLKEMVTIKENIQVWGKKFIKNFDVNFKITDKKLDGLIKTIHRLVSEKLKKIKENKMTLIDTKNTYASINNLNYNE